MMPSQSESTTDQLLRECAATGGVPNARTHTALHKRWQRLQPNSMTPNQRLQAELIRSVGRSTDTPASVAETCIALGRYTMWDLDRELFLRLTHAG